MNVCISYQFHDDERRIFVIDTAKLRSHHPYEAAVKAAAEGGKTHVVLNGPDYDDDWGGFSVEVPAAVIATPCRIDKAMNLDVVFE